MLARALPLDLNQLSWFYWFAPLRLQSLYLCDWEDHYPQAQLQPPSYMVTASLTYGYSLPVRLGGPLPAGAVAASLTRGSSLHHVRLRPPSRIVTACLCDWEDPHAP